ncbi:transmembrane protein 132D-like [Mytilus galloprovincialis]|uniref:transmembrane protein 132D-like n=1 Tax=Mytilus galloprovincialis TaxID=29158 RepID=UPI003F7B9701
MSWKRKTIYLIAWTVVIGLSYGVDITINNQENGFFLKPIYNKHKPWDPAVEEENFVITQKSDKLTFHAFNGPFDDYKTVTGSDAEDMASYLQRAGNNNNNFVYENMDVSAHIVSQKVSPKWPKLQIMIHASPRFNVNSKHRQKSNVYSRTLCGHIFVRNTEAELSSICVIGSHEEACVATISLPNVWWHSNSSVDVYYAVSSSNQNQECASASNSIKALTEPEKEEETSPRKLILSVILSNPGNTFEVRQDEQIRIYVPTEVFEPKTIFEIPVKLETNSTIQVFVMRCRVRDGLIITGAIAKADGPWQIHVDINERQKIGSVTAFVRDTSSYKVSTRIQDIFKWQLEVEDDRSKIDTGRIVWSVEYERTSKQELYVSQESRIVSHINIRSQKQDHLVPVVKVNEVLNLAMLTGVKQIYPLGIYLVSEDGGARDVTYNTACHSVEEDIMKVASNCSYIYLDGTERRGSHNVTIITKSGHHTAFIHLTVWIPMTPLDISLSDNKLSLIRGWKVASTRGKNSKKRSRNKRLVDLGMLTHPSVYLRDGGKKYKGCHLRYQQAELDIYGVFYIATSSGIDYFKGKKVALKLTDLLQNRLRVSDPRIAQLKDGVIQGVGPGVTEIQVLSPNGHSIAISEVRVGSDKVSLTRLVINVITGVTVDVLGSSEVPGALLIKAHIDSQFRTEYQEGIINIALQFSDETRIPLKHVNPDDYHLAVSTSYRHLVGVVKDSKPYQPRIVAIKEGRGELFKIEFKLGKKCHKKKTLPLQTDIVIINADFSLPNTIQTDQTLNDWPDHGNQPSERRESKRLDKPIYSFKSSQKDEAHDTKDKGKYSKKSSPDSQVYGIGIDLNENLKQMARSSKNMAQNLQNEPEKKRAENPGLSPLEVGMYVLLAVFGVVFTVFFSIVLMYRHKKKHATNKNKGGTVAQANDWVWIGRATLERNAINTQCSQALMPDNDFNGNRPVPVDSGIHSGIHSGVHSAQSSNRNSFVSTIKGSECSIRITANPLPEELPTNNNNANREPEWDYEAMGMNYDQLADYFDNLKESTA